MKNIIIGDEAEYNSLHRLVNRQSLVPLRTTAKHRNKMTHLTPKKRKR